MCAVGMTCLVLATGVVTLTSIILLTLYDERVLKWGSLCSMWVAVKGLK